VRFLRHMLLAEEHPTWGQAIYEELADTPDTQQRALAGQMNLEAPWVRAALPASGASMR
jgi:hypothetical protein